MSSKVFAGSAIKQNAGKISNINDWSPTTKQRRWLLIAGSSHPPEKVHISMGRKREAKGEKSGKYLQGISLDLFNMERSVGHTLKNKIQNLEITKAEVANHITSFFQFCLENDFKPMLYYSGHGEMPTGNWCFTDGTIGVDEILEMVPEGMAYPTICSDACYSGTWADFCIRKGIDGFECLSACKPDQSAFDNRDNGGELTLYMTGNEKKLTKGRPVTEPLFSRGSQPDYPTVRIFGKVHYAEFIKYHTYDYRNILISQSIRDGYLAAVFASDQKYNSSEKLYWESAGYADFLQVYKSDVHCRKFIYSLKADESTKRFYAYSIEGFGDSQVVLKIDDPDDITWRNMAITSCTACKSKFYFVLSSGVPEFENREQVVLMNPTFSQSDNLSEKVADYYSKGFVITSMCYNKGKKKFLVVMTKTSESQVYKWFTNDFERVEWIQDWSQKGYICSLFFQDHSADSQDRYLVAMTTKEDTKSPATCFAALYNQ